MTSLRQLPGLVADGRDMGTVIFPDAWKKFFLTATAEERARRRQLQLQKLGIENMKHSTKICSFAMNGISKDL